jgi:2'-5' RNA ligase
MTKITHPDETVLTQVLRFRAEGLSSVSARGIQIDAILANELETPGSDVRCGISFVARPPAAIVAEIQRIQADLAQIEGGQYYYPSADLHATLLEVAFGQSQPVIEKQVQGLSPKLQALTADLPGAVLEAVCLGIDQKGCALSFAPADDGLYQLRTRLKERLLAGGISVAERYQPQAAHISLLRYIRSLRTEPAAWAQRLAAVTIRAGLVWRVDALTLTYGANWYGQSDKITAIGPLALQ